MEKFYTISSMTGDNDLFEVTLYEDEEEEVNEYLIQIHFHSKIYKLN